MVEGALTGSSHGANRESSRWENFHMLRNISEPQVDERASYSNYVSVPNSGRHRLEKTELEQKKYSKCPNVEDQPSHSYKSLMDPEKAKDGLFRNKLLRFRIPIKTSSDEAWIRETTINSPIGLYRSSSETPERFSQDHSLNIKELEHGVLLKDFSEILEVMKNVISPRDMKSSGVCKTTDSSRHGHSGQGLPATAPPLDVNSSRTELANESQRTKSFSNVAGNTICTERNNRIMVPDGPYLVTNPFICGFPKRLSTPSEFLEMIIA